MVADKTHCGKLYLEITPLMYKAFWGGDKLQYCIPPVWLRLGNCSSLSFKALWCHLLGWPSWWDYFAEPSSPALRLAWPGIRRACVGLKLYRDRLQLLALYSLLAQACYLSQKNFTQVSMLRKSEKLHSRCQQTNYPSDYAVNSCHQWNKWNK